MRALHSPQPFQTRRAFLGRASAGLGSLALAALADPSLLRGAASGAGKWRGMVRPLHVAAKAKRVIFLYMSGGPSHLETFDPKPELACLDGKPMPESFTRGQPIAQLQGQKLLCLRPLFSFQRFGRSGQTVSEVLPHIGSIADHLCIIRSMKGEAINHDPAHTFMNTGTTISGRPSMGSWVTYGIGNESNDLPGFVVMTSQAGRSPQPIASRQWHSGFLPGQFQGVAFQPKGDPVHYVRSPGGVNGGRQRDVVHAVRALDELHDRAIDDPEIATRIGQYELAFRMQASVPGL